MRLNVLVTAGAIVAVTALGRAQCLVVEEISVPPGPYEAGDALFGIASMTCSGPQPCGLCLVGIHLDGGCGPLLGVQFGLGLQPGESRQILWQPGEVLEGRTKASANCTGAPKHPLMVSEKWSSRPLKLCASASALRSSFFGPRKCWRLTS